jgi:branched-subunit amino acid aminotransferase/4-amino-4-deoxychorismate lyase
MTIPEDDRGLLLGDGLFETILWTQGRPALFEAHVERMTRGCAALGLPAPATDALLTAALRVMTDAGLQDRRAAVRLTWSAGSGGRGLDRPAEPSPRLIASAAPSEIPTMPARLVTASVRRNEGSPTSRLKTLAYLDNVLARREARQAGADEALMLNNLGEVACATAANLFWFEGERLVTPALACGTLDGIMRAQVLEAARGLGIETIEARVGPGVVGRGAGLFVTNSLIGVRPVGWLDGEAVAEHAGVARLSRAVSAISSSTG